MECLCCNDISHAEFMLGGQSETGHACCYECFPYYLNNLTPGSFVAGSPRCPVANCNRQCISSEEFGKFLGQAGPDAVIRYVEIINTITAPPAPKTFKQKLDLCLEITCPSCEIVQDADPAACRAMQCLNCRSHYCWICLTAFNSSTACHTHVSDVHNHGRGPFVLQRFVDPLHAELRKQRLNALMAGYTASQRRAFLTSDIRKLLNSIDRALVDVALNPRAVPPPAAAGANGAAQNPFEQRGNAGIGAVHGAAAGAAKVAVEKVGLKIAGKAAAQAVGKSAARTAGTAISKSALNVAVSTTSKAVSSSAIGSVAVELTFIGYDMVRLATGHLQRRHVGAQIRNRLANMSLNASGSAIGAGIGTLLLPGWGTVAGSVVGSMIAGTQNYKVV